MSNDEKILEKNAWSKYDENGVAEIFDFCEGYKSFMSKCKTERECINEAITLAEKEGYKNIEDVIKS